MFNNSLDRKMKVCDIDELLALLDEKGYLTEDVEVIKKECVAGEVKKEKKPSSVERQGKYDEGKCQARIWAEGYDQVQCSFLPQIGTCFCKRHSDSDWWLGKITDPKPEKPILYSRVHPNGLEHQWRNDENIIEETISNVGIEGKPKRRGRPKGSKNKKKKDEGKKPDMSIAEIQALIAQKEKGC